MKKRISAIMLIIALTAIIITGCSDNKGKIETNTDGEVQIDTENPQESDSDIPDWFELPSISIDPGHSEDVTKADTGPTNYYFHSRTDEENIKLASINEIAGLVLKNEYSFSPPKGRIITYIIEEDGIRVSEFSLDVDQMVSSDRTIINPDKVYSVGALFYGSSRNRLPAWLSAGLELYWSDRFGFERLEFDKDFDMNDWFTETKDFSAFGDAWFEKTDDKSRLSVAFLFVKWLDENRLLNEMVRAYLNNKQAEGDLLFADAWEKFTGQDIRGDFCFKNRVRHLYGNYIQSIDIWDCYRYSFLTQQGNYLFDWLPRYTVMEEYINDVDTQYAYAKEWLGFQNAAPIPTRILTNRGGGSFTVGITGAEYICLPGFNTLAPVHEAFHYLLAVNKISSAFLWLWEGLPEAIGFIYGDENPESSYAQGMYYNLTKKGDYSSTFDFKRHAHLMALDAVNYFIENDIYGTFIRAGGQLGVSPEDKPSGFRQGYLNTYATAASFAIYMLEIGSKEDFMRMYTDLSVAKELYGKDFNTLYEQWLEFLKQI